MVEEVGYLQVAAGRGGEEGRLGSQRGSEGTGQGVEGSNRGTAGVGGFL